MKRDVAKRRVDALIFDLDGTLVNSVSDLTCAVNHALKLQGRPAVTEELLKTFVGDGLLKLLSRALGTEDPAAARAAAESFRPYYDRHCLDSTALYDGVTETLDAFSSKKLAVISNKPEAFTKKILAGLHITRYFEIVLGPESVQRQKPDPESNLLVARKFGIPPGRFCCIGDRQTDVEAGRGAGMMTVGVTYGIGDPARVVEAKPDALIGRLTDLENFIE